MPSTPLCHSIRLGGSGKDLLPLWRLEQHDHLPRTGLEVTCEVIHDKTL